MELEQAPAAAPVVPANPVEPAAPQTKAPAKPRSMAAEGMFWLAVAVIIGMGVHLWFTGEGDLLLRMFAYVVTAAIPLGTAYWGKRSGMWGPSLGAISLMVLYWLSMNLGAMYGNDNAV